jgi:hypothetical protein
VAGRNAYVGRITGAEPGALYGRNDIRNRIFSANIRHYVENTKTNEGIEATIVDPRFRTT